MIYENCLHGEAAALAKAGVMFSVMSAMSLVDTVFLYFSESTEILFSL